MGLLRATEFALIACLAGCGSTATGGQVDDGVDGGVDAVVPSVVDGATDGAPDGGATTSPDALPTPDAGHDSGPLPPDGGADSGPLAPTIDGGVDARDGAASGDGGVGDGGGVDAVVDGGRDGATSFAVCPDLSNPTCAAAQSADDLIRATFASQPCTAPNMQCGAVLESNIIVTYPLVCRDGIWRLSGAWVSGLWVGGGECSQGCRVAGRLCAP